ncbi:hypothetical protein [Aeoliella sp.]|uniref:hypothetical protein n=1 Tax=Aeoliella sp. TaxID=2795800 RepID=UPI003CCB8602
MLASTCALRGLEGYAKSVEFVGQNSIRRREQPMRSRGRSAAIGAVIVAEFRDEVYASIQQLLRRYGITTYRAQNATELAGAMVRHRTELVLLSATQPDESAWLSSAKLRILDSHRSVWIYTPTRPSALDEWLSMAGADDVIVYGGVLHSLIDSLQLRLGYREFRAESISA